MVTNEKQMREMLREMTIRLRENEGWKMEDREEDQKAERIW